MTAILGLSLSTVESLLAEAEGPVYLANINADNQLVIAGSDAAMAAVAARAKALGASCARRLAMSVPSHCALLEQPARELAEAFAGVSLRAPQIRYLSSSSARPIFDSERLRDDLAFNMCRVVDWHGTLRTAYERGVRLQIELPRARCSPAWRGGFSNRVRWPPSTAPGSTHWTPCCVRRAAGADKHVHKGAFA